MLKIAGKKNTEKVLREITLGLVHEFGPLFFRPLLAGSHFNPGLEVLSFLIVFSSLLVCLDSFTGILAISPIHLLPGTTANFFDFQLLNLNVEDSIVRGGIQR